MDATGKQPAKHPHSSRPTARDVARLAGVSQSTVSRILSGDPSPFFSEKTRRQVLQIAEQLNYSPNPLARALRGKQTQLIGLIVRGISDPFLAALVSELSVQAGAQGYQVVLGHAESDPNEVLKISKVLDTRHIDGVILLGDFRDDQTAIQEILEGRRAVVAMCRGQMGAGTITINADNRAGMLDLLDHITGLGHQALGVIDGGWLGDFQERRRVFQEYLAKKGMPFHAEWMVTDEDNAAGGYRAMQRLMRASPKPSAVLALDDIMAIGALKAALDGGLRIPLEISISGFDGIELTKFVTPALTTVRQPVEAMSERALEALLEIVGGGELDADRVIRLPPRLIVRDSTGPAPLAQNSRMN